jgi:DNA-binding MurR/RpiR family transcriptional regulator
VNNATTHDLLIAMEVAGQAPYIAHAMDEARKRKVPTAAIVSSASMPSARFVDVVIAAQAHPSIGLGIVSIEAVVYALAQALNWRFTSRFEGSDLAISKLSERIRQPLN